MKKLFFFVFMLLFAVPISVRADDHIYSIDMNIIVEKSGDAIITEVWDVQADGGTEWCKRLSNLENTKINNFNVVMDEEPLKLKENWKYSDSLKGKANQFGVSYSSSGVDICFGKKDMERHQFRISYSIPDYVVTTEDSQVLYHTLASNVTADKFYADIITYYGLPSDLELWGLGYEGTSFVDSGRIVLSNYDGLSNQHIAVLVKFPLKTFDNEKTVDEFKNFNDVFKHSERSGYEYKEYSNGTSRFTAIDFIFVLLSIFVVILIIEFVVRNVTGKSILKQEFMVKFFDKIKGLIKK